MAYQEEFYELNIVKLRRMFPLFHLWRVPGIAFEWRKLLVCYVLITFLIYSGIINDASVIDEAGASYSTPFFESTVNHLLRSWQIVVMPLLTGLFHQGLFTLRVIKFLMAVIVILTFGTILSRLASQEFSNGKPGTFRESIGFVIHQFPELVGIVAAFVFGYLVLNVFRIVLLSMWTSYTSILLVPFLLISGAFWLILYWLWGCHFMILASVATDGTDTFDAFSRAYSYTVNSLGYFILVAISAILLSIFSLVIFVCGLGFFVVVLSLIMNQDSSQVVRLSSFYIEIVQHLMTSSLVNYQSPPFLPSSFQKIEFLYQYIRLLVPAAGLSLFWSNSSAVYFLLRNAEDGIPMNEIYKPSKENSDQSGKVPLVGLAERAQVFKTESPPS